MAIAYRDARLPGVDTSFVTFDKMDAWPRRPMLPNF